MRTENWLTELDFFGVNFELRMENYEKFRTKTGGSAFIVYIISATLISIIAIFRYFYFPFYKYTNIEQPTYSQNINFLNDKFNLAIKLPDFKKLNESLDVDLNKMFIVNATLRTRNISRIIYAPHKEKKDEIAPKNCTIEDLFNRTDDDILFDEYKKESLKCFDFKSSHSINNSQFKDHSYIRIDVWVNKTYLKTFKNLVKEYLKISPYFITVLFPQNIVSDDDLTNSMQFLNGIFLYLTETDKTQTDIYLKKSVYVEDNNLLFPNAINYTYADYHSHDSVYIKDDFYYLNRTGKNFTYGEKSNHEDDTDQDDEHPKIAKIQIRNHVMIPVYRKTRDRIWSLIGQINSTFVQLFLTFKVILEYINLYKAKINILQNLFEIGFKNFENSQKLNENESYTKLKAYLNEHCVNLKNNKMVRMISQDLEDHKKKILIDELNTNHNLNGKKNSSKFSEMEDLSLENKNKLTYGKNISLDEVKELENRKSLDDFAITFSRDKKSSKPNNKKTSNFVRDFELIEIPKRNVNYKKDSVTNQKELDQNETIKDCLNTRASLDLIKKLVASDNKNELKASKDHDENTQKKADNRINLRNLIDSIFCCNFVKLKKQVRYFQKAEKLFDEFFDVQQYIKKMNEVEILKNMILNDNQKMIFEFLSFPTFSYSLKRDVTINPDSLEINNNKGKIGFTFQKDKLIDNYELLFRDHEDKYKSKRLQVMYENKIKI